MLAINTFNENQVVQINGTDMKVGDYLNSALSEVEAISKQLETITKESVYSQWDQRKDFMLGDFGTDLLRYKKGLTTKIYQMGQVK